MVDSSSKPNGSIGDLQNNEENQLVDDATTDRILMVLMYGVIPTIGCVGVTWNVFSIIILSKHGLRKCSNILLVSLAFSDATFLIAFNNIPNVLYELQGGRFLYSETSSRVLYVAFLIFISLDYIFSLDSLTFPMLITIERLVAVFLPLKFSRIITPARTWFAVAAVNSYYIIYIAYTCFWYEFEYVHDSLLNRTVGIIGRSQLFYDNEGLIAVLEEMHFSVKVPPLFTLVGCVIIIVKVKLVSIQRTKLTANAKATSTTRTTKTLLAVCFFYVITCTILALPRYLPKEWINYNITSDKPSNLGKIMYLTMTTVLSINSTWNFLVYVGFNKNFRETFRDLTIKRCCAGRFNRI